MHTCAWRCCQRKKERLRISQKSHLFASAPDFAKIGWQLWLKDPYVLFGDGQILAVQKMDCTKGHLNKGIYMKNERQLPPNKRHFTPKSKTFSQSQECSNLTVYLVIKVDWMAQSAKAFDVMSRISLSFYRFVPFDFRKIRPVRYFLAKLSYFTPFKRLQVVAINCRYH